MAHIPQSMLLPPTQFEVLITLTLATWAITWFFCESSLTRVFRDWGWQAQSYPAWKRLPLLPLVAMRTCTICTSWWVAAGVVAAAQPGLIPALFLVPAIVGATAAIDAVMTALWRYRDKDKAYDPLVVKSNLAADKAFQKMVDEQRAKFDAEAHAKWKASLTGTPPPPPTSPAA